LQPSLNTTSVMTTDPGPTGEISPEPPPIVATPAPGSSTLVSMAPFAGRVVNRLHYRRIGHTLAAIVFGLLGALLGTLYAARSEAADG
jgi:hypothetical protein